MAGSKELVAFLRKSKTRIKSTLAEVGEEVSSKGKEIVAKGVQQGRKAIDAHGATAGKVALGGAAGAGAAALAAGDSTKKKKRPYLED
jgi:hypothetical protein